MAVRNDFTAGEVLAAADLNDTFASKLDLAGGKVLQVVRATDTTNRSTSSNSFTDVTGMSVTITPQKSDSAIIVFASVFVEIQWTSGDNGLMDLQITDSSNNAISGADRPPGGTQGITGTGTRSFRSSPFVLGYATPATTSATTYKLRFRVTLSGPSVSVRNDLSTGQMYAIEVSA